MVKDIFAVENQIQKAAKKKAERAKRKRKHGSKGDTETLAKPNPVPNNSESLSNSSIGKEQTSMDTVDEFDLMEEPDIEIGIS